MDKPSLIKTLKLQGIHSQAILDAIEKVPREDFVPIGYEDEAYENHPLPIGHQQTISQPYIVAKMTELILTKNTHKILEIGTGSGYQAAILSRLVEKVYTVERIWALYEQAKERFKLLDYHHIYPYLGDGHLGLSAHAPYNAIIVTAATPEVPPALLEQLADGGRLLLPLGKFGGTQQLQLITRQGELYHRKLFEPVVFVPMLAGTTEKLNNQPTS